MTTHRAIAGALVDRSVTRGDVSSDVIPHGRAFVSFESIADAVAQLITQADLAASEVGSIRRRRSARTGTSYVSNGCVRCDALIGNFPLQEEVFAAEIPLDQFPHFNVTIPRALLTA